MSLSTQPDLSDALSLTVVILTRNEAHHLERCIRSIAHLASRIVVVDSGSTDSTIEIAKSHGAEVFERRWVNYADQFQWALDHAAIDTEWVMRLDADEWLGDDLLDRLQRGLLVLPDTTTGITFDRRHYFMGRWIKRGGRYPLRLLRIWRNGAAHIEQRWMDEHIVLDHGATTHFAGTFVDENLGDLGFFIRKHEAYATREAIDALVSKYGWFDADQELHGTQQAAAKRKAKNRFYNKLPLGLGPFLYFLYRYVIQLGFLDGKEGLIYHTLQGFWYRFLVDAKRFEFERVIAQAQTREDKIAALSAATGHDIAGFFEVGGKTLADG